MQGLSLRREAILNFIIREHVATAAAVASEAVASGLALRVSPATVRNEMAFLENDGYITRPHVSAGAVPADKGYRFYVQQLLQASRLSGEQQFAMRRRFERVERDIEAWTGLAALLLSELVHNLAIVTSPWAPQPRVRHMELVYLQELLVLLVVVLQGARLRKKLVPLQEPVDPAELTQATNKLNAHYGGLSYREMISKHVPMTPLEEQVLENAIDMMEGGDQAASDDYLAEGLRHLLGQPEFAATPRARELVEALEEHRLVQALLVGAPEVGTVRVIIGEENQDLVLKPLSVVVGQYGVVGEMAGTVGIIGPTRMEYERTVAGVQFLSSLMSDLIVGMQGYSLPT